tara:strand:- start:498 stop:617 length:120 start_codon:yes stop_codon:yes gene_type:complete
MEYQEHVKDEEKTKECWWCGNPTEKDLCSKSCATYYFNE